VEHFIAQLLTQLHQSAKPTGTMADEQTADFFQPMEDADDAPILLGPPADETPSFAAPSGEYIGEIDAAPPAVLIDDIGGGMFAANEEPNFDNEEESPTGPINTEPSPMAAWNNEWQVTLRERKDTENDSKGAAIELAQTDLSTFQAGREAKRESKAAKNRADEQDKLEAIDADLENDNSWQRVVKMVELSHDSADGSADCGRMRDLLIFLKNDTDRAAILA